MDTSEIVHWLASERSFAAGRALYERFGTSTVLCSLFAQGETNYSRSLLVQKLQALVDTPPPPPAATPVSAPVVAAALTPAADSPLLTTVRHQLRQARDERSRLHAQLTAPRLAKKDRLSMALRICDLTDQEGTLKETEAHVLAHGRLPGPVPTAELDDPAELRLRLNRQVNQRSKLRKRPDRADALAAVEEDIRLLRKKLNLPERG